MLDKSCDIFHSFGERGLEGTCISCMYLHVLMSSVEIRSSALRESNDFVEQIWRLLFVLVQSSLYLA